MSKPDSSAPSGLSDEGSMQHAPARAIHIRRRDKKSFDKTEQIMARIVNVNSQSSNSEAAEDAIQNSFYVE